MSQLYSITGDNASNNIYMAWALQNRFAQAFLDSIGALTDKDYEYFDHYVQTDHESLTEQDHEDEYYLSPKKLKDFH
ncbi:hypothetical protein O181_128592 [Austropuccinia psidii MF-1]|uniref:Uncharacterized protein n=1 Tax=Austropuccinia psidii MF-1 TaxID=1389203 RepID=A0A9Q3QAM1_9BASI|nr:hypothetical protein [Austropuccinia psidii MF-1]